MVIGEEQWHSVGMIDSLRSMSADGLLSGGV